MRFDASAPLSLSSGSGQSSSQDFSAKHSHTSATSYIPHLYEDLPPTNDPEAHKHIHLHGSDELTGFNSKFGLLLPNPAPDVAPADETAKPSATEAHASDRHHHAEEEDQYGDNLDEPRKKKYAKEAWPGRKPLLSTF